MDLHDVKSGCDTTFELIGEVVQHVSSDGFHSVFLGDEAAAPFDDDTLTHGPAKGCRIMRLPSVDDGKVS